MTTSSAEASSGSEPAPAAAPVTTQSRDWAHAITLYVSNIPLRETEPELQKLFEPFGKVLKVYFKRDRTSLEFQGTAFVAMETHDAARAAIDQLNGASYKDLRLRVEESRRPYDPNYRRPRRGRSPRRWDRSPPPYRRSPTPLRRRHESDSDDDYYRRRGVRRRPPEREVPTYEYSREREAYDSRQSSRRQERRLRDSDSDR
jgi:RNA recognition motif-containing protein